MNLEEKLKKQQYKEIWQQYCGFLDLSMDGYMQIQRRVMEEQIRLFGKQHICIVFIGCQWYHFSKFIQIARMLSLQNRLSQTTVTP